MKDKPADIDSSSVFWNRIKLSHNFIFSGAQKSSEVEAGNSTAKLYRISNDTIRIDIKMPAGGESNG